MGRSKAEKQATHTRIVATASERLRRDGMAELGVAELMRAVGLTHGGFYRHFGSRDELIDEAVEAAIADGAARVEAVAAGGRGDALQAIIDAYLSPAHRDHPEVGCAVASLTPEVLHGPDRARSAYTRQVEAYIELITGLLGDPLPAHRERAILIFTALVGALSMARAVDNPALSDELLRTTAGALLRA